MAVLTRPNLTGAARPLAGSSFPIARFGADSRARRSRSVRVWAGSKPILSVPVKVPTAAVRTPWTDSTWLGDPLRQRRLWRIESCAARRAGRAGRESPPRW